MYYDRIMSDAKRYRNNIISQFAQKASRKVKKGIVTLSMRLTILFSEKTQEKNATKRLNKEMMIARKNSVQVA